jgi:16S rRNA C967 or C1407 C5-methylase (RsmB/RsmF family)
VSFDEFYGELYGSRWPGLKRALLAPAKTVAFADGLLKPYHLDEASVFAATSLGVQPEDEVLDLCAAPGGKALVMLATGRPKLLVANDRSATRRARLHRVVAEHVPEELAVRVRVRGHDATKWCLYETDRYDRILLDVPCSSERHVLGSPSHLARWSPGRTRRLAAQAFAMLAGALDVVRCGGIIVYATCTVCPLENEEVIRRLLARRRGRAELLPIPGPIGEAVPTGRRILPDAEPGLGPMFVSRIRRLS